MRESKDPGLPDSQSTRDLLADWNIDRAAVSCWSEASSLESREGSVAKLDETTAYPHGRMDCRSHEGSLRFLDGFSLSDPEYDDPTVVRMAGQGPADDTTPRDQRPIPSGLAVPLGIDRGDRGSRPASGGSPPSRDLPATGDVLAGFRILRELGRGAFARVYLAEEIHLGGRLVAIKVSRAEGDEPRILARLQHTNIVPVHSVCDDRITGLRVLCMPFFGGASLAQVLDAARGLTRGNSGHSLVEALDEIGRHRSIAGGEIRGDSSDRSRSARPGSKTSAGRRIGKEPERPVSLSSIGGSTLSYGFRSLLTRIIGAGATPSTRAIATDPSDDPHQPSRQFLRKATAIQAAVWIVARLAEGLDHAHSRGLLHRDLKPANILIAADGTPMLLDFNLSIESDITSSRGEMNRAFLGGTLPYMAPEHLDAFDPRGTTPAEAVGERADIYALGLILYEMLAGDHPFPVEAPAPRSSSSEFIREMIAARRRPPSLKVRCPLIPSSLDALVAKCLEFEPSGRYDRARDLADDLRRFLNDLPMKHGPEPSLRERAGKFARRHQALCSSTSIAIISLAFIVALGAGVAAVHSGMQGLVARFQRQAFEREFTEAQFLLNTAGASNRHLAGGLIVARRLFDRLDLPADGGDPSAYWFRHITSAERHRLREQIIELMLLEARARVLIASRQGPESGRLAAVRRAVTRLDRAEQLADRAPAALFSERGHYHAALGNARFAERDRRLAALARPTTSHDWALLGTTLLAAGQADAAEDALREALRLDCSSFRAWFMMGHCHYAQSRFLEAAGDFSACTAVGSQFAWVHFNRGLALARAGLRIPARDAYDQALRIDPAFEEALVNRALVELELDQIQPALADLTMAIKLGRQDAGVLAARGEALARLGRTAEACRQFGSLLTANPDDRVARVARAMARIRTDPGGAREDFEHILARDPHHAAAHYGMANLVRADDPAGALKHLESALDSDPNLFDAIQLRALIRARLGDPTTLDDVDRLLRVPTAERYYNAACAVAVYAEKAGEPRRLPHAVELLGRAVDLGFHATGDDPDLASLRPLPAFRRLLGRAGRDS